ncbi:MAG: helix-turn-helix domain-containing protein [Pseudomonadota bacterium]
MAVDAYARATGRDDRERDGDGDAAAERAAADAARAFAALGAPQRVRILRRLVRAGEDGLTMGALQRDLGLAASTTTHHMRQLVSAGLVRQERRAREIVSRADYAQVRALAAFLIAECCADAAEGETR